MPTKSNVSSTVERMRSIFMPLASTEPKRASWRRRNSVFVVRFGMILNIVIFFLIQRLWEWSHSVFVSQRESMKGTD